MNRDSKFYCVNEKEQHGTIRGRSEEEFEDKGKMCYEKGSGTLTNAYPFVVICQ